MTNWADKSETRTEEIDRVQDSITPQEKQYRIMIERVDDVIVEDYTSQMH